VRGIAHIGVIKGLIELGIRPTCIAGTSVGSLVGVAFSAGMAWPEIAEMARSVFWPRLLVGRQLELFCEEHFPANFSSLRIPFAAITTDVATKTVVKLSGGKIATAISASCAQPPLRKAIEKNGSKLADGGAACVLPSETCWQMGADVVIASDVYGGSAFLRSIGCQSENPIFKRLYPSHYRFGVQLTDILIRPRIPLLAYLPFPQAVDKMISAGEQSTLRAFGAIQDRSTEAREIGYFSQLPR
jgi:NTE family protein